MPEQPGWLRDLGLRRRVLRLGDLWPRQCPRRDCPSTLWNGSAWVRYSVVDGTMVPGSSDFMVAENDILYISN